MAQTGQQWLENREPSRQVVASHLINLAWNGMAHLQAEPRLIMEGIDRRRAGNTPEVEAEDQTEPISSRLK